MVFFRVKDLIAYLTKIWGKPDLRVKFLLQVVVN